jgi:hypothetical protein
MASRARIDRDVIFRQENPPGADGPVGLHRHDLALQIEISTTRQEALAALAQYLASNAAAQLSRQGQNVLVDIVSTKIASLPDDDSAPLA